MALWLGADLLSVAVTLLAVWRRPNRQMPVMNWVWPLVSLYFGPVGLLLLWMLGRGGAHAGPAMGGPRRTPPPGRHPMRGAAGDPLWMRSARSATHCLAGCALGDLSAMAAVGALGLTFAGSMVAAEVGLGALLAFGFGLFIFQALPIMAERGTSFARAFRLALTADLWTISAYLAGQVPAFLWLHRGTHTIDAANWVSMQISMAAGFVTSFPVNYWLVRTGMKEGM